MCFNHNEFRLSAQTSSAHNWSNTRQKSNGPARTTTKGTDASVFNDVDNYFFECFHLFKLNAGWELEIFDANKD